MAFKQLAVTLKQLNLVKDIFHDCRAMFFTRLNKLVVEQNPKKSKIKFQDLCWLEAPITINPYYMKIRYYTNNDDISTMHDSIFLNFFLTLYALGGGVQSARISFFLRLLFFF